MTGVLSICKNHYCENEKNIQINTSNAGSNTQKRLRVLILVEENYTISGKVYENGVC